MTNSALATTAPKTRVENRGGLVYIIDVDAEERNRSLFAACPGEYRTGEPTVIAVRRG